MIQQQRMSPEGYWSREMIVSNATNAKWKLHILDACQKRLYAIYKWNVDVLTKSLFQML